MKAAITGANGFVGRALINQLLNDNYAVSALVRDPARAALDAKITVIKGDLDSESALSALAEGADIVFHLAGVTFPRDDAAYEAVNVRGAAQAAEAAAHAGAKFVHASSMSAREPSVSPYARSKRDSEGAVAQASGNNPWVALRLPAIYGPGDHATLPFFKLVKSGLALAPHTTPPARASILYVDDAARALIAAGLSPLREGVFEVGDDTPAGREWGEIGACLGAVMDRRVRRFSVPRPVVAMFHNISRGAAAITGKTPDVRKGQVNEFFHTDWSARENLFADAAGWRPEISLEEGFRKTVRWYRENALL